MIWPFKKHFLSPEQIADVLFERMKDADGWEEFVKNGDNDELYLYHHHHGRAVRNEFKLWDDANPYTMLDYVPQLIDDCDMNPKHPDNLSGVILRLLYEKIKAYHANQTDE